MANPESSLEPSRQPDKVDGENVHPSDFKESPDDHAIFNDSLSLAFLRPRAAQNFIGRRKELHSLSQALTSSRHGRRTVLLSGHGGIGKTQLAVQLVEQQKHEFRAILWLNGRSKTALDHSLTCIARRITRYHGTLQNLESAIEEDNGRSIAWEIMLWLSQQGLSDWLAVFDSVNYERADDFDVQNYFPEMETERSGSILITTRMPRLFVGNVIHLDALDIKDSVSLLTSTYESQSTSRYGRYGRYERFRGQWLNQGKSLLRFSFLIKT